jgi:hypothetical protein
MKRSADDYAAAYVASLDLFAATRPRSLQAGIGVSDIGHCSSKALWQLTGVPPSDMPTSRQALMGQSAHETIAAARKQFAPHLLIETEVTVTLPSGVELVGHIDELDPTEPSVTDTKTLGDESDLIAMRRTGSSEQQRFQRHLYYYGAYQAGLVPAEGTVRNVWMDRSGRADWVFVEQEPFDMTVVHNADRWLTDILYAAEHGEEVPQEKHYDWCRRFCQFFSHCRSGQMHSDKVITDPEFIAAASLVHEGREAKKVAVGLEDAGKRVLALLQASAEGDMIAFEAGDFRVRWSQVNAERGPYWKLAVEPV